jgi:hypothetical protein
VLDLPAISAKLAVIKAAAVGLTPKTLNTPVPPERRKGSGAGARSDEFAADARPRPLAPLTLRLRRDQRNDECGSVEDPIRYRAKDEGEGARRR